MMRPLDEDVVTIGTFLKDFLDISFSFSRLISMVSFVKVRRKTKRQKPFRLVQIKIQLKTFNVDFSSGWLDDLSRFQNLISLNLADNDLGQFPPVICQLTRLIELNLASNSLDVIPTEISRLQK